MKWVYLALAIGFEIAGTTCMKLSDGFSNLKWAALMALFYSGCFIFLTFTVKRMEVSLAYAIWSGVGVALLSCIGIFFFKESFNAMKLFGLVAIIVGVVALRLSGAK
ncbi:small multidrug resistance pump [Verrucomicrobium sp. GAS474]|uniref:DMT family transporter n=1 Tax=Verrucomicrobium sp. GAS474 TaxID=1882831 RepID=UPI00087BE9B7|nr:multidrug efflux SMR transporter [Verrucomicrobium sp. GAS474]SDU04258.1 small multidrug resistance pump [Verrucomicrobium sp. GAS474]